MTCGWGPEELNLPLDAHVAMSSRRCASRPTPWGCGELYESPRSYLLRLPVNPVVQLDRVTVRYGRQQAMRDVTATFPPGAVGLLGPNGAGKSTMLRALLGFVVPDQGQMRVLDLDVKHAALKIRSRIGYMPESDAHIPGMNAVSFVPIAAPVRAASLGCRCSVRTRSCTTSASARRGTGTSRPIQPA
jgi:hypothetical protein